MEANDVRTISLVYLLFILCSNDGVTAQDKAKKMCEEYAQYVYADSASPVLTPGAGDNKESQCGIVEVPLIVGGVSTGPKEFPHQAVIGFGGASDKDTAWMCGASVISERYVLTAAHCIKSKDKGPAKWVRTGDTNLEGHSEESNPQVFGVAEAVGHPEYKPPSNYHDIALLKLDKDIKFDGYTRPACLNTRADIWVKTGIATGFGRLGYDTDDTSKDLLKVNLQFIPNSECGETYKFDAGGLTLPRGLIDGQLCAGEKAGGKDTCQGDSGGPLQTVLEEPYCMYSVIGVTSFGKFCGFSNSPAVYSRVSSYVPWIEGVVWP